MRFLNFLKVKVLVNIYLFLIYLRITAVLQKYSKKI